MKRTHLDLFDDNSEVILLKRELSQMRKHYEKVRRSVCSRHNQLAKLCLHLKEENEGMRRRIDTLEKVARARKGAPDQNENFLKKLFEEAYMASDGR